MLQGNRTKGRSAELELSKAPCWNDHLGMLVRKHSKHVLVAAAGQSALCSGDKIRMRPSYL